MRIVTNPGSNLDEDLLVTLDVDLLPQKIIVDGLPRDTRNTIDFAQVDDWVKRSRQHPVVQGTTEKDFVEYFSRLVRKDPEVLCVMTSRKLIGSHDAAVAAAQALKKSVDPVLRAATIEVVDTLVTDVGAGLCTLVAVEARKAGLGLSATAAAVRAFAERGRNVFTVATLANLIKGGRASSLQGFVANFLDIRPVLSLIDGSISSVARVSAKTDSVAKAVEYLEARVDRGVAAWVAISHGNVPDKAQALATALATRYRCEKLIVRPLSPSIYLHVGPGALVTFVYPLAGLPFTPT